ncbi:hypothetical protein SPRG_20023 [Saprolegnia parasitica CBS 223.65]|uniref:DUF4246 domain-containing protein n=1 Tax=Saprolegnia parasitica (strain CBS 223.65) TaxID=695850 RepID=A0A067CI11_SAPPC|nr:hypothetical protein SPRG_20023 [Saprolegnia parasitica CBS 223.65]KDO28820.1 hypothetical protein SPRG_20023 [Saprolegnia parasitica CBS 223.65]|eukprot:XP_012200551.1 hypothetical protein SPRG_20023 [Saprolegnia parasitica CBS 223.65]
MGWAPGHAIAYASLELAYLAVLGSVVSARHWTPSPPWPSPSTLPPPGIALLHAELDQVRNDHAHMRGVRRAMARRVYFVDVASTLPSALQTSLSPLEATATWRDDVLEIVDPALYGAIYGRTRFAPRQHRFRVDSAPSIVGLSLVTESALRGVTCPVLQMLPTPILWDNTTESVTLESYINNVPASNEAAYEALTDSLRVVLPLLDVALGLDCDDYSPHRLTRDLTSTKTLRKMYRKQRGLPQNATVSAAELDAFIKSLKLQHPSYPRESVRMSSRPWPSPFVTTAEPTHQGICHVTAYRASAATSTTAWRRGSGAINEAARFTALVFYDVTNVEAQLECLETFASVCTEIDSATQEEIFLKKPRPQWNSQVTDRLPVYQGRVVLLASSVAHRLRLRALDATQPSGLKLVAWDFVSDRTGGILTTADVFPQQQGALQASLHGTWLESLLPDIFDMVVAFLGCSAISESEAQAAAAATKANRDAIVRASIGMP